MNKIILETSRVQLRPLEQNDFSALLKLSQDDEMWNYFTLNLKDEKQLETWMELAFREESAGSRIPFTIIDKEKNKLAGSTSIGNISTHDLRAEIGWSWLGKDFRNSGLNKHAKFAMLKHIFETWNYERVEFKTDVLNERAKQGLRNVGGVEEGILRSHMTMWNNRRRTSVYFSILKEEWSQLKKTTFKDLVE